MEKLETKVILLFSAMFLTFLFSWTPLAVIRLLFTTNPATRPPLELLDFFMLFRFVSSVINPTLYTLFKADVQMTFREDLHRATNAVNVKLMGRNLERTNLSLWAGDPGGAPPLWAVRGCAPSLVIFFNGKSLIEVCIWRENSLSGV